MRNKFVKVISLIVAVAFCVAFVGNGSVQKSGGGPPYNTNAPGEKTCSGSEGTNTCHSGGIPDNSGPGTPSIVFSGGSVYVPGQTYTVTPTIYHPTRNRFGFQIVSLKDSNDAFIGTITLIDTNKTRMQQPTWGSYQDRIFVMHQLPGTYPTTPNLGQWTYKWTAPSYNAGTISFYACYNAANNNNTNDAGDQTYWTKITINPSAVGISAMEKNDLHTLVYPNPCKEYFYLVGYNSGQNYLKAELLNAEGKIISILAGKEISPGKFVEKIELQNIPAGIYFVKTSFGGKEKIQKLLIN